MFAMNFLLIHGFNGSPNDIFFPLLTTELNQYGQVNAPELPNPSSPTEKEQLAAILKQSITKDTIIIGHSLGAVVALKTVEKLNHSIKALILVGGFLSPKFRDKKRPFEKTFDWNFDFEKIKKNAQKIIVLSAKNDYAIPIEQGRLMAEKLGATLIETNAEEPHFTADKEPQIMNAVRLIL